MAKKKLSRAEKRAEEERIIAEMDAAMKENAENKALSREKNESEKSENPETEGAGLSSSQNSASFDPYGEPTEIHCRKCGTLMKNGVCPRCGYKMYTPMDVKTVKKVRLIVGVICLVGFAVWLVLKLAK